MVLTPFDVSRLAWKSFEFQESESLRGGSQILIFDSVFCIFNFRSILLRWLSTTGHPASSSEASAKEEGMIQSTFAEATVDESEEGPLAEGSPLANSNSRQIAGLVKKASNNCLTKICALKSI